MSDLDSAINSINNSALKAENTANFLDDMSTLDDQSSATNPNNGQTVASIPKQVKDRTDELFTAAESDINQAVADAEQSATDAQDAADSIGRYQGLWPDTGGSANKGDTYQTQVSGTPTGKYFTALQNTTVDPVGDNVNWKVNVGSGYVNQAQEELISGKIFPESGVVKNGDIVPVGATHLRVLVGGEPTIVAMSPVASGSVSLLTTTGATIGVTPVTFDVVSTKQFQYLYDASGKLAVDGLLSLGDRVVVDDYHENGDSGALFFRVVAATTGVGDGGKFIDLPLSGLQLEQNMKLAASVKDWGAKGDNSTNDTVQFQAATSYINNKGGGKLIIPPGVYIVHNQEINTSPTEPYYQTSGDILGFTDCKGLIVEFQGATLKTADGLNFGAFDPSTGVRYDAPAGGFTDSKYAATMSTTLRCTRCENVTIINPILDGNITSQNIGGYWGDTGIQLDHSGIRFHDCKNVTLISPKSHYYGLDSFYVTATTEDFDMGITVLDGDFQFSGRQAFSWTGGDGVTCINTKFLNTGKNGSVSSAPGSGMDVEDNGKHAKDGTFINCTFANNTGADLLILNTADRIEFKDCVFAGSNRTVWNASEDDNAIINFVNCKVYGNIVYPGKNSTWENCYITDKTLTPYDAPTQRMLDDTGATENTTFKNCLFEASRSDLGDNISVDTCTFLNTEIRYQRDSVPERTRLSIIRPKKIDNLRIVDELTNSDSCIPVGEHAYIDASGYVSTNVFLWQYIGDKIAAGSRTGSTNTVIGSRRNASLTDARSYTGDSATEIKIPLGVGTKLVTLTKASGNTALRRCKAIVLVCSNNSPTFSLHQSVILTSVTDGLGAGGIAIQQAGISSSSDALVITSDSISLDGEVWNIQEIDLTLMNANVLQTEPFGSYTLPATGFPI
ncbi:hypothetical protein [Vibrio phage vB_VcM_SY]